MRNATPNLADGDFWRRIWRYLAINLAIFGEKILHFTFFYRFLIEIINFSKRLWTFSIFDLFLRVSVVRFGGLLCLSFGAFWGGESWQPLREWGGWKFLHRSWLSFPRERERKRCRGSIRREDGEGNMKCVFSLSSWISHETFTSFLFPLHLSGGD